MNARLDAVIRRRGALVQRAGAQRAALAGMARPWRRPLALLDAGIALASAAARPVIIVLAVALLARVRRAHLAQWVGRAATAWQLYRAVRYRWPAIQAT